MGVPRPVAVAAAAVVTPGSGAAVPAGAASAARRGAGAATAGGGSGGGTAALRAVWVPHHPAHSTACGRHDGIHILLPTIVIIIKL